ncbi:MAG: recombination regulator RecX [Firmicutes bacterium]|nr:recombination regulator RecX [Bacillota bacterium]
MKTWDEAWEFALRLLGYRGRSKKELSDRLKRRGFPEDLTSGVISRLEELGLLDDATYARRWIQSRAELRPSGRHLLAWELEQKGIDSALVRAQMDEELPLEREEELALALARKRLMQLKGVEKKRAWGKLANFLSRRGFDWEVIQLVLNRLLDDD